MPSQDLEDGPCRGAPDARDVALCPYRTAMEKAALYRRFSRYAGATPPLSRALAQMAEDYESLAERLRLT